MMGTCAGLWVAMAHHVLIIVFLLLVYNYGLV